MQPNRRHFLALTTASIALGALPALAAEPEFFQTDGIAINGSDAVAYFAEEGPVAGSSEFTFDYMGATWLFASAQNRDAFAATPAKYAPQFGGYCAYAVSRGYTATTDPNAWTIYEGKLYLNYSRPVRAIWATAKASNVAAAEANWPGVLNH